MTDKNHRIKSVRVLNLSRLDLPFHYVLKVDTDDVPELVKTIRRHADLPFVYVVDQEKAHLVPELLAALKAIRSPCFPYAVFSVGGTRLDRMTRIWIR